MKQTDGFNITREEVLAKTKLLGLDISVATLNRYAKSQLITPPQRGHLSKGHGTFTFYPAGSHIELATAFCYLHGLVPKMSFPSYESNLMDPLFLLPKVGVPDLLHARKRFFENFICMNDKIILRSMLLPYCACILPPDMPEKTEAPFLFDYSLYNDECAYLRENADAQEVAEIKDLVLNALIDTNPIEPVWHIYKAVFCRFALWDNVINAKNENSHI